MINIKLNLRRKTELVDLQELGLLLKDYERFSTLEEK